MPNTYSIALLKRLTSSRVSLKTSLSNSYVSIILLGHNTIPIMQSTCMIHIFMICAITTMLGIFNYHIKKKKTSYHWLLCLNYTQFVRVYIMQPCLCRFLIWKQNIFHQRLISYCKTRFQQISTFWSLEQWYKIKSSLMFSLHLHICFESDKCTMIFLVK